MTRDGEIDENIHVEAVPRAGEWVKGFMIARQVESVIHEVPSESGVQTALPEIVVRLKDKS